MNNRYLIASIIIITALIIIGGYVNNSGLFSLNSNKTIKIGVIQPLSEDMAMYGLSAKAALELASDSIDYKINNKKIELILEDGRCNPGDGAKAFNKLINVDNVDYIIGGLCSSETLAGKELINQSQTLTISNCASSPELKGASKYLISLYPLDDTDGRYSAEYIYNKLGLKTAAILSCQSDWCKGEENIFYKTYLSLGGEIKVIEHNAIEETDLKTSLTKIKNSNAEIIFAPQYIGAQEKMFLQAKEINLDIPFFVPSLLDKDTINKHKGITNGAYGTRIKARETNMFFTNELKRRSNLTNVDADLCSNRAYDALMLLKEAIEKTNSFDNEEIINYIKDNEFSGLAGNYVFDQNYILAGEFETMKAINGELIRIN